MALRPSVIQRIRQIDVNYITHMQNVLAKKDTLRSKTETVVLRMIYNTKHIKMVQRLQPPVVELAVPSIGLRRKTTTTTCPYVIKHVYICEYLCNVNFIMSSLIILMLLYPYSTLTHLGHNFIL